MGWSKEAKRELESYRLELKKKELERKQLIRSKMDWAGLEEFINKVNSNPSLHVKATLADGTVLDLWTEKKMDYRNPLFTEAAFVEDN